MRVTAVKRFSYSTNGRDTFPVKPGEQVDIPDHLVSGLAKEKYISVPKAPPSSREIRANVGSPETQAIKAVPETKGE